MKKILLISLLIITISMIFTSGCIDTSEGVSATLCDECSGKIFEKTSAITIARNGLFQSSYDNVRLHVIDCDGVSYNTYYIAAFMGDLDKYDNENVTFTYSCNEKGYYQIHTIKSACEPIPIKCCNIPKTTCNCDTPTPIPTKSQCPC